MPEEVQQPPQIPQTQPAQQAGMSESALFGLSYITIIPAIIFLVTAPYNQNPKVRFHAWQSIFLVIGWIAAAVVLTIVGFIPIVHLIDIVLFPLTWAAFGIAWLVAMINGFMGKTMQLPILGALAAKQAGM